MSTFNDMDVCMYTTQGKIVCRSHQNPTDTKKNHPVLLERFAVNELPNQKDNDCMVLSKRFNDLVSTYSCSTSTQNQNNGKCTFQFDCTERN